MMSCNELSSNEGIKTVGSQEVNKLITLINLQEALSNENYEVCSKLVAKAEGFGASASEVSEILSEFTRRVNR